ncbi:MAG: alpha/beta family hydrolase [Planctomycetota bacterium]
MRRIAILCALPLCLLAAEEVSIPTPRGVKLKGTVDAPAKPNGCAVVLAAGKGYHGGLPLLKACAERLAAEGFYVVRFEWAYFTAKKEPAPDLSTEIEDLEAAIAYAKGLAGVKKVIVAGKSLGSVAALLRAVKKSDDLVGVALLTFPVHSPGEPAKIFPEAEKVADLKLPVFVLCGDKDDLCSPGALYGLAASCPTPPTIVIVPGDHSLKEGDDALKEQENVALAAHALAVWAKRRL